MAARACVRGGEGDELGGTANGRRPFGGTETVWRERAVDETGGMKMRPSGGGSAAQSMSSRRAAAQRWAAAPGYVANSVTPSPAARAAAASCFVRSRLRLFKNQFFTCARDTVRGGINATPDHKIPIVMKSPARKNDGTATWSYYASSK